MLGAYSDNWPLDCPKSSKIIENAAAFYRKSVSESNGMAIPTALPCLFLLSTGDDANLPVVRQHIQKFIDKPNSIGDHTWNNGYNGILFAEYYFRTGDEDVLPLLQAICDDAKERQNFNSAWKHWGPNINPGYVSGGLMNPASTQVLTTLLLSKEAGVDVDDESARDNLSMATLDAYPSLIRGHADNGRGDGIWRGIGSYYLMEKNPAHYREVMDRIAWWYDLSRFDDGAMGLATCKGFNDSGSGAGAAMTYTAPLKTLRITGAPRSKYAKEFELPAHLWGTEADLVFHRIEPASGYETYGEPMPIHQIVNLIGSAYSRGTFDADPESVSVEQLQQFVRHNSYMIRTQAAKALRIKGELKVLEALLQDPDPRLRRAALDGINDWNYFFATGKQHLEAERFTPEMIELIAAMLKDPQESNYVVEGALFAFGFMPSEAIKKHVSAIMPWAKHEDWWFRHVSFAALQGMEADPALYVKAVPILNEMMVSENHTMAREAMHRALARALKKHGTESEIGKLIVEGFNRGVAETQVLDGPRGREGRYNITIGIGQVAKLNPETGPQLAALLVKRGLSELDDDELRGIVSGGRFFKGFLDLSTKESSCAGAA